MKIKNLILFSVITILVTVLSGVVSALSCGDTITTDTILTDDLLECGGNGLIIGDNNIILDCQGYIIDGNENRGYYGIFLDTKIGVTIQNCIITDFYDGIGINSGSNNIVTNNDISSNSYRGIVLAISSYDNSIIYNNANSNNRGIEIESSSYNNNVANNDINSNGDGILLTSSSNNLIMNNNVNSNNYGIVLNRSSDNNNISNNNANNNQKHGLFIYAGSSNIVNSNIFCLNNQIIGGYFDINNEDTNSGDENACDTTYNWNDIGATGCTYSCSEVFLDFDEDGVPNSLDLCPNTPLNTEIDTNGCSAMQFCSSFNPLGDRKNPNRTLCKNADWKNNEATVKQKKDCYIEKNVKSNLLDDICMAASNAN